MKQSKFSVRPSNLWLVEDNPRNKMLIQGIQHLTEAELLAMLLGNKPEHLELARAILRHYHENLHELAKASLEELSNLAGMNEAKAANLVVAMELGRRRQLSPKLERKQIRSSKDAYEVIAPLLMDLTHEEFWVILMSRSNMVLRRLRISIGGVTGTVVDVKKIFSKALHQERATSLIVCHNHPSGNRQPSQADFDITRRIKEAAKLLDFTLFDHLIVCGTEYYSFADEGNL
jgi:DNA repair protein RadC